MEDMEKEKQSRGPRLSLRLYVAGDAPNSVEARANLKAICRQALEPGAYDLEIIDVLEEPLRALEDGVLVTPTLMRVNSASVCIIGTLEDHDKVKRALELA